MLASVRSAAVLGVDAFDVTVEVDCARGLPQWTIVGMAATSVKESRERVSAALANAGIDIPPRRMTINLAPSDVAKTGTAFDLPIAVAVLVALGVLTSDRVQSATFLGELGLDGSIRPVRGALPVARRQLLVHRGRTLVLPRENVQEAALVRGLSLCAPQSLAELIGWLRLGDPPLAAAGETARGAPTYGPDFADVVGQESAKRALEIAAAGGHNALLVGPPGAGKTLLARCVPAILPPLTEEESLEVTAIHSVAGLLRPDRTGTLGRPFRAPHHSVSTAGLIGGGSSPRPGEVSLAHHGVLFLDELLEFPRHTLESLRQPLEDGRVMIARASSAVTYPARFTLIAAMNPCPCGNFGDSNRVCVCAESEVLAYRGRLSGPLMDRIDLHVLLAPVRLKDLGHDSEAERSSAVRARVEAARALQRDRDASLAPDAAGGAAARGRAMLRALSADARTMLDEAGDRFGFSARGYHRVLRVARTIADLAQVTEVGATQLAEALRYRQVAEVASRRVVPSITASRALQDPARRRGTSAPR